MENSCVNFAFKKIKFGPIYPLSFMHILATLSSIKKRKGVHIEHQNNIVYIFVLSFSNHTNFMLKTWTDKIVWLSNAV